MKSETTRRVNVGEAEKTVKVDGEEMQAKAEVRLKKGRFGWRRRGRARRPEGLLLENGRDWRREEWKRDQGGR